ncbi:MAG: Acylphosphatase [Chlamydiae bacterium]|nr:Acylphosphatase [Chlamydiota bacterium]
MKKELHAIFKGCVQGVFFRATIVRHADNFPITGTVQNLSDGSVELYAQGEEATLLTFLNTITQNPGSARLTSVTHDLSEITTPLSSFQIKY